jgi:hypothetical protein
MILKRSLRQITICFFLLATGCIQMPSHYPVMGVDPSPPSPNLVAGCNKVRTWHNIWTVMATIFGAGTGVSVISALVPDDRTAQLGIAIAAGISGLFGTVSTSLAGIEANAYSNGNCAVILVNQPVASSLK